jgi:PAS domain S-box-containing protein
MQLRILFVEDSLDDVELCSRELKRGGYEIEYQRVETAEAMQVALEHQAWDVIICDYVMPQFSPQQALEILQAIGQDLPFIIVSGTIGEETAVSALKAGAHDFLIKGKLARLVPAIQRELKDAQVRRERKRAEDALRENVSNARSLLRLSKRLEQAQTYSDALDAALEEVKVVLGYHNVWTYLLSEDKQQLLLLTTTGGKSHELTDDFPTLTIKGDRFLEEIIEGKDVVLVEDARTDPRTNKDIVAQLGNRTIVNVPIILMDTHLGAFGTGSFGDEGVSIPTSTQLDYLRALASHMAVTLDRVHLLIKRKQTEAQLRESEERYRTLIEQASDGIFIADPQGNYTDVNSSGCAMLGYAREEILKLTLRDVVDRDELAARPLRLKELQEGKTLLVERKLRRKNGSTFFAELSAKALPHGYYQAIVRDVTERKRAEQAEEKLHESEERYRRFFENMHETFIIQEVIADGTGKPIDLQYLDLNPAAERILGKTRDEIIGRTRSQLTGRPDPEGVEMASRVASTGTPFHMVRHSPGFGGWFESFTYSLGSGIVATLSLDITERKQAEEAQHRSEQRLNGIITSAMDAIISVDSEQSVVLFNAAAEKMFGCSSSEAVGQSLERFIPERFRAVHRGHVRTFGETGVTNRAMNVLGVILGRRTNGEEFPIEASISQIEVDEKKLYTVILRDITEHKRAEERQEFLMSASKALASSLDYETTLTTVAQLAVPKIADWCTVYLTAPDGSIEQVALTHADPGKVKWARELQKRFPPNPNAPRGVAQVIRSGQAEFTPEIPAELLEPLKKDPEMSKLLDELQLTGGMTVPLILQGRTLGAISFVSAESRLRYTTEDLELAEELARRAALAISNALLFQQVQDELADRKQAEDELKRSNAELEQFAYVASHDLQEPLRAVAGMVQLLGQRYQGKLDGRADEYIGLAVDASTRMQRLINDLLDYSRVTRHSQPLEEINAEQSLNMALANLQIAIQESNVQITHDPLPTIMADAGQLIQVLQNLIGNAIKFRGERPLHIHIDAQKIDQAWQFKVSDNGIGIEPQYFERIFLVFQRLHTRREYPGTGIGLSLCKKIIERHGGRIWVESEPGQGSTFYFTIPRRQ